MALNKKIVYVGFAFPHHKDTHAGYHRIKDYLDYDYVVDCQSYYDDRYKSCSNFLVRGIRKINTILFRTPVIPWFIFRLIWLGLFHNDLVFHFIYGENTLFSFKRFIRKGNKVICTLHQPLDFFKRDTSLSNKLKRVDGIILVGQAEMQGFQDYFQLPVEYIPHGISTDFYKPDTVCEKRHQVLTVGSWLRDYVFADKVYQRLLQCDSSLVIHVVTSPKNKELITPDSRVFVHSGISDEELRKLYCLSNVLFLPLIRYTANNSLLEAGATGSNIVIASNFPDNSYIPETYINLVKMDVDSACDAIIQMFGKQYNSELSCYVNENYSWHMIAKKTKIVLSRF